MKVSFSSRVTYQMVKFTDVARIFQRGGGGGGGGGVPSLGREIF